MSCCCVNAVLNQCYTYNSGEAICIAVTRLCKYATIAFTDTSHFVHLRHEQSDQWWSKQTADGAYHVEVRLACCRITDDDSAVTTADVSAQQHQQQQQQHSQHVKVSLLTIFLLTANCFIAQHALLCNSASYFT
jgi:hypothetical protein